MHVEDNHQLIDVCLIRSQHLPDRMTFDWLFALSQFAHIFEEGLYFYSLSFFQAISGVEHLCRFDFHYIAVGHQEGFAISLKGRWNFDLVDFCKGWTLNYEIDTAASFKVSKKLSAKTADYFHILKRAQTSS